MMGAHMNPKKSNTCLSTTRSCGRKEQSESMTSKIMKTGLKDDGRLGGNILCLRSCRPRTICRTSTNSRMFLARQHPMFRNQSYKTGENLLNKQNIPRNNFPHSGQLKVELKQGNNIISQIWPSKPYSALTRSDTVTHGGGLRTVGWDSPGN